MTTLQIVQDTLSHVYQQESSIGYTPFLLSALGFLGIFLHNLVELNKINKATNGNANIGQYIKIEIYSIIISIIMVVVCVISSQEIKQIEQAGKWLGLAFVTIGYMGQSILIFFMGKVENKLGK